MGRRHPPLRPAWTESIGKLHDEREVVVYARCGQCGTMLTVDLAALIAKVGRDYSLWDRRPPCRTCPGRIMFRWSTGTWTWMFDSSLYI